MYLVFIERASEMLTAQFRMGHARRVVGLAPRRARHGLVPDNAWVGVGVVSHVLTDVVVVEVWLCRCWCVFVLCVQCAHRRCFYEKSLTIQEYLAHNKMPPPRTLH